MIHQRLIIIEDDNAFRELLREMLKRHITAIDVFPSSELAKEFIESCSEPFLILSDIDLPGQSGLEHLIEFRKGFQREPFYLMSGRISEIPDTIANLSNGFIKKPFSMKSLLELLRLSTKKDV